MSNDKIIVRFTASLPPVTTAIAFDGNGDGGTVKLAFSADSVDEVSKLLKLTGMAFEVVITPIATRTYGTGHGGKRAGAGRKASSDDEDNQDG